MGALLCGRSTRGDVRGGAEVRGGRCAWVSQGLVALTGLRTLGFEWVAPLGLRDCGHELTQGLVALAGLRTLGFERGRPAGASGR